MGRSRGFTYIELIATVAIVAVLARAALPMAQNASTRNKELELRTALREIRAGIDRYKKAWDEGRIVKRANEPGYPPTLQVLVEGVEDAKSPGKAHVYFLRRLPRDPFSREPRASAAETWGKRSYESPADAPREGAEVFDVYSRSAATGLNGVPYHEW